MICWQCHEPTSAAACIGCGALQPPPAENDPYKVLNIPRVYHLDLVDIDNAWRTISRTVHPDKWAGKKAVFRRMSLQWTALANEARRILKDPMSRARYLSTGDPKPPERGGPKLDNAFLESMFDLQMMAADNPDMAKEQVLTMWDREQNQLNSIFRDWEAGSGTLDGIDIILAKLQYLKTARTQTGV